VGAEGIHRAYNPYRLAAQQNLAVAQTNLGTMYQRGCGVARDLNAAVRWYQLAAAQGAANARDALRCLAHPRYWWYCPSTTFGADKIDGRPLSHVVAADWLMGQLSVARASIHATADSPFLDRSPNLLPDPEMESSSKQSAFFTLEDTSSHR